MKIEHNRTRSRTHILPMWIKIVTDFNKGVPVIEMVNNTNYLTQTKQPFKSRGGIYRVLREMKEINL